MECLPLQVTDITGGLAIIVGFTATEKPFDSPSCLPGPTSIKSRSERGTASPACAAIYFNWLLACSHRLLSFFFAGHSLRDIAVNAI